MHINSDTYRQKLHNHLSILPLEDQARAVRAYKKMLARHYGDYSKYDGKGNLRTPFHLR